MLVGNSALRWVMLVGIDKSESQILSSTLVNAAGQGVEGGYGHNGSSGIGVLEDLGRS
jgi:hypothetical protein